MRRLATSLVPALAGAGVAAALQQGLFAAFPDFLRLGLAFLVLVLLPGAGWLRAIGTLPPGGAWLAPGWAMGLGVAWLALGILLTRLASLPFLTLLAGSAGPRPGGCCSPPPHSSRPTCCSRVRSRAASASARSPPS